MLVVYIFAYYHRSILYSLYDNKSKQNKKHSENTDTEFFPFLQKEEEKNKNKKNKKHSENADTSTSVTFYLVV